MLFIFLFTDGGGVFNLSVDGDVKTLADEKPLP